MVTATGIGVTLGIIVGILFIIGAIVALGIDLASADHMITYPTIWLAVTLVAVGIAIIITIAYLQKEGKI